MSVVKRTTEDYHYRKQSQLATKDDSERLHMAYMVSDWRGTSFFFLRNQATFSQSRWFVWT